MIRNSLLAFSAIFIAGCATVAPVSTPPYFPSNPTAVLLKHQGEIEATGSVSTSGETFTAAYAPTPHLGLLASGSMALHKSGEPNGNQYAGEIGIGLFDTSAKDLVEHEVYGSVGWGTGHNFQQSIFPGDPAYNIPPRVEQTTDESILFWHAWLQADAGYAGKNGSFMVLVRFSFVNIYHDVLQNSMWDWDPYMGGPGYINYTSSTLNRLYFITPGFEARIGFEHIQLKASILTFIGISGVEYNSPPILPSLGLSYKF